MNGNVFRTITIRGTSEGLDKLEADIKKVAAAEQNVAVVSEQTAKRVLSLEDAWKKQTLKLDEAARAQANYSREAKVADAALRQGLVTQQQHAERIDLITQKYNQGSAASKAFATATSGVSGQLVAMAAGAGPVGVFLSALGPWGMAAAAGIGLASAALSHMTEEAARIGNKAADLKKFSDITGLTAEQLRAINKVGGEAGVSSDELATAIGRFTTNMDKAREGGGELYEQIRKINPALASQLAASTSTAEALDVYARAMKNARDSGDTFQRNALAQAGGGRGGRAAGLALANVAEAGGIDAITAKTREASGVTNEWVANVAKLTRENEKLLHQIADMKANAYAQEVLERQNQFLKGQKELVALGLSAGRQRAMPGGISEQPDADLFQEAFGRSSRPGNLPGDAGLGDIATSIGRSAAEAVDPLKQMKDALAETVANASAAQSALGSYGDAIDKLRTQQEKLTLALLDNAISGDQYTKANDAIQQQITYLEQMRVAYGTVNDAANQQLQTLQLQTNLANARTASEQQSAQYAIAYAQAYGQVKDAAIATQLATAQLALQHAEVNKALDEQLKSLQEQAEVLRAESEVEKARIKAAYDYDKAVKAGGDSLKAGAVAAQSIANARTVQDAREQAQADQDAAQSAREKASANQQAAAAAQREQRAIDAIIAANREWARTHDFLPSFIPDSEFFTRKDGTKSQFDPKGYTSLTSTSGNLLEAARLTYGNEGFDQIGQAINGLLLPQFVPNAKGMEGQVNQSLKQGGTFSDEILGMLGSQSGLLSQNATLVQNTAQMLSRLIALFPDEQKGGFIQKELDVLMSATPTLARSELIVQLNQQLEQLKQATEDNTSATSAMTDVLSPFYSSDPRRTHLGFRAFAGGGIMSQFGELPIRHYQGGGMATSPQVAVFGEGSTPEAYVPVPSGRIPVEIKGAANSNQRRPVTVNINVMGNADQGTVAALRSTAFQQAQAMRRVMA
jgi:hypothetical protein